MNHSKKDIRSLTIFYKICAILGVVPCYCFGKTSEKSTRWKQVQGVLWIFAIAAGTVYSMYIRHTAFKNIYTTTHLICDYIDEFFLVSLAFTVIFNSCFCERKPWMKLNHNLQYIDEILKNTDISTKNILYNPSLQFLLYFILYVLCVLFLLYTWVEELGIVAAKSYAMHQFCFVYDVFLHFLIYNISSGLKHRYDEVNKLLENEASEYWEKKVIVSLRKIENILQCLSETVDMFNDVFGTVLVFITGKSIAQLLTCLNFLTNNLKIGDSEFKERLFIANLILVLYTLISVSFVMMAADAATASSRKTIALCYKFQEHFVTKSEARQELFKLAQQATANAAVITAANFFQINKSTLFGIFGTTTTYFIIILQFNQSLGG